MHPAPQPAAIGTVISAQAIIFPKTFQLTALRDRSHPTATTLPTIQCVVDTGKPIFEHNRTVLAVPRPIQNPLKETENKPNNHFNALPSSSTLLKRLK